jgi:hypothetical protein
MIRTNEWTTTELAMNARRDGELSWYGTLAVLIASLGVLAILFVSGF